MIKKFEHGYLLSYRGVEGDIKVMNLYFTPLTSRHNKAKGAILDPKIRPLVPDVLSWWDQNE